MSTTRRRLGTGPATASPAPDDSVGRRLLPAELADRAALLADQERAASEQPTHARRALGGGANSAAG